MSVGVIFFVIALYYGSNLKQKGLLHGGDLISGFGEFDPG